MRKVFALFALIVIAGCTHGYEVGSIEVKTSLKYNDVGYTGLTYITNITDGGFNPAILNIKAGDKVIFNNLKKTEAFVIGIGSCEWFKSGILNANASYEQKFSEQCSFIDSLGDLNIGNVVIENAKSN